MSHTTEVKSVLFVDIEALRLAVKELQGAGIRCELVQNQQPRAYYENQQGLGVADYVLRLADARFDVGFYQAEGTNGYVARTDLWNGEVQRVLGSARQGKESAEQAAMGKLYQSYAINAATRQAAKQGYSVRRVTKADGSVQLIMNV